MDQADRDRKKAWKAQQMAAQRGAFPLSDESLQSLFSSVELLVEQNGCDHSLRFTEQWTAENSHPQEPLFAWLRDNGGYCDCEVVANAQDHWQQNR